MKNIILFLLLFSLISCNSTTLKPENHDVLIEKIVIEDSDSIILEGGIILFCKSNSKDKIGYMDTYDLIKTYNNDPRYQSNNNEKFVSDIINLKIGFDCDDIIRCFSINDTVKSFYNKSDFSKFLLNYCTTDDNIEYRITNNLSYNSQLTVIYYLFKNNYYTVFEDLSGFYYSGKIDHWLIKQEKPLELEES